MEKSANPQRTGATHRLEGSRFSSRQLCDLPASGSLKWPIAVQFYRNGCIAPSETELLGKGVTRGHSREPPASHVTELKPYKAAPLQALGMRRRVIR